MIYIDDNTVKVGGVVLPGLYKSMEIKADAQVEEQEVEGSSAKPKQAIGYEDAKITLDVILNDGPSETKEAKLQRIQNLFRKKGQAKPEVHQIVNSHTAIRGISKVIFKNLTSKETNKKEELAVSMEFWEYVPMTITAKKASEDTGIGILPESNLTEQYESYLSTQRGTAPKISDKTAASPAVDDE